MAISQTLGFVLDHFEFLTLSVYILVMIPKLIEPMLKKDKHYQNYRCVQNCMLFEVLPKMELISNLVL